VEHLAGVDRAGHVQVFWWSPKADWQAIDVTVMVGPVLNAGVQLTSWQVQNSCLIGGTASDGTVWVRYWSPEANWQAVNVSAISGAFLSGGLSS
jgi:hypothetical protein